MYNLIKLLLFLFPPEKAHHLTIYVFRIILRIPILSFFIKNYFSYESKELETEVCGLKFSNPIGLAAGFDKDGKYLAVMSHLGFGFIEVGTVTPRPQKGNPLPRLFRLKKDSALINRMGFNNNGVDALVGRLKNFEKGNLIIGGNIGKNKDTPNENATDDYVYCFERLFPYVDYFVVNVSSPNTPGLRSLQEKEPLSRLLQELIRRNNEKSHTKPLFLKIAPDLNQSQLDDVIEVVSQTGVDGIIATNTTISRQGLRSKKGVIQKIGNGGLSGVPLKSKATEIIRYISKKSGGSIPIIGVGGISGTLDALEKIDAGSSLIQVYTGLIYQGPGFIKNIKRGILTRKN